MLVSSLASNCELGYCLQLVLAHIILIRYLCAYVAVLLPAASQSQGQSLLKVTWAAQGQQQAMTSFTNTNTPSASYNSAFLVYFFNYLPPLL